MSTEAPRMTIAKNILQFQAMSAATNEAGLAEAAKPIGNLDVANLPPAIAELEGYLSTPVAAAGGSFSRDPHAWQNKEFVPMVADAAAYTWFWPFLVGGAYVKPFPIDSLAFYDVSLSLKPSFQFSKGIVISALVVFLSSFA